jgi:hypothetical protein
MATKATKTGAEVTIFAGEKTRVLYGIPGIAVVFLVLCCGSVLPHVC